MPWWAALLIAVSATAIGYAVDTAMGHKDLTHVFAAFYIAGCVAAVLAVRQEGVFTAIIQPPLILFCAVPGAYWMFHGRKLGNLKDLLINCGYPLIERFPLMLGTAGGVLLIGLVRWYFGKAAPAVAAGSKDDAAPSGESHSFVSAIGAKLNSFLGIGPREDDAEEAPAAGSKRARSAKAARDGRTTARGGRSGTRSGRSHSRTGRPPVEDDPRDDMAERPRRRRPAPPRDFDPAEPPPRQRRRPRPPGDPDGRAQPRETRREPRARRDPYDRPSPWSSRFDGYEPYEPPSGPERFDRYESYEPRRRRPAPSGNGNSTHHPISRVRYRGETPSTEPRDPRAERRGSSRAPRGFPTESWEYEG